MKILKNLLSILFFILIIQQINFAQNPVNPHVTSISANSLSEDINVYTNAGVLHDSIVHLVWENYDDNNIQTVVLESSNDGINFTRCAEALITNLIDIHIYNYPTQFDYYNHILMSSEHGNVRFIYNDVIKNRDFEIHPIWYRVKMKTFSGYTYATQKFNSNGKGQEDNNTIANTNADGENNSTIDQVKAKVACPSVGTPPLGYTNSGITHSYNGDCCTWIETRFDKPSLQSNVACPGDAWCCNTTPGASACASGYNVDYCCVHHCADYSQCSCVPWTCCTNAVDSIWVVTSSTPNPPISLSVSATLTSTCSGGVTFLTVTSTPFQSGINYNWMPGNLGGTTVPVAPFSTTTYTVTGTNPATSCTGTASITVNVNPKPVISVTALPTNVCVGVASSLTTSSNIAGTTFLWTPVNLPGATISVTPAVTTTYTVTGTTASGCTGSNSVTVTVNATPVLIPTATPSAICRGDNSTLCITPQASTIYVWNPGSLSGNCVVVHPAATTCYTVTATNTVSGCTASAFICLVVYNKPVFTVTASPTAICSGGSSTLSANCTANCTGITYIWMPGGLSSPSISVHPSSTTTYTVTATNASGCTTSATVTLTVNPKPNITTTATPATICLGASSTLSATSSVVGTNFVWMPGGLPGTPITVTPAATTIYTVTGTTPATCTGTAAVSVTVKAVDNPAFNYNPSTICTSGGNVAATITGGSTGTFTALPAGLVFLNASTGLIDVASSIPGTYTVTFTTNGPSLTCHSSSTVTITITNAPSAVFSYAGPFCNNGADPFPTFGPGASGGTFSSSAGLVFISTATGQVDVFASLPGTYTVTNAIAAAGGCGASSSTNTITINAAVTPTFTPIAAICSGAVLAALPTTSNNGITGTWLPAPINTATTTYTFTPTAGLCATTATLTIVVNPNITPTFNPIPDICSGAPLTLPPTSLDAITGTWSPAVNNTVTTTYTFSPSAGVCATTATLTVVVNPNPVITPTATPAAICVGGTSILSATTTIVGTTYVWNPDGLLGTTVSVTPALTTIYTVIGTAPVSICTGSATVTVMVNAPITPTFAAVTPICSGDVMAPLPTTSLNGYTGIWTPALNNSATTTYNFISTLGQCATSTTLTVVVNPNITPIFTAVPIICSGDPLSPLPTTSNNGITGTWSPPTMNNTATTIYTFTPTSGQCANTTTLTVTVNPIITPTFAAIAPHCEGFAIGALPVNSTNVPPINGIWTPAVNNTATTTYTFTPAPGGCATTTTLTITVIPNVTTTFNPVGPICNGDPLAPLPTTSANGISGTWSPSLDNTATTTYTFSPLLGQCGTITTLTIIVNPYFTPTFNPVAAICSGAALAALPTTSTNGITGSWAPALNNAATTTYTFTPTAGLCATTTTLTITVNPNVTPTFTAVAPICSGAALAALPTTSTNGITGSWAPALNNAATTTYTFTPTAGQCATTTTLTITVNPNITPTFTAVAPICSGAALAALPTTSTNGITGSWAPALNNTATTTYTFTPTAGLCATTTTLTITVNPNITPTFTAVTPICSGAALAALPTTSTNGITGSWAPALDNTATTTYTFTPTAGLCATTTTLTITVNPNITPTFTAVAPICSGAALAALPTTSTNGITGSWAPALNNAATTTYTFTPTAGLCATTTTLTITVNPNIAPTFTAVAPICSGAALPALPTTSTNGITGSWAPALNNAATTTYTFTPTAGLCATTTTLTITVNPNITPTFTAVAPICSGAALAALPTTSTNGITGSWAPALDNTATTIYTFTPTAGLCATTTTLTITVNPNVTPTFTAVAPICSGAALAALPTTSTNGITGSWAPALDNTATTIYTFTPTAGLCATTTTLTITVNPNVTPTFTAVAPICSGAALAALPTTSTNGITGSWAPALNNAATTTYTFTPTAGLCATTTTFTITVNPNFTPTFTAVALICSGAALAALPTTSTNGITGTWAPALNNTATTTYTFTPTAGLCATTTTLTITVNPNVTPTFTAVAPICSGAALAALPTTSTNGITGSWAPALNNTATTTYTFTPTAGLCATTTTLTITVNPNVTPTFTAVAPICSGAALAALPNTSTNGITGSWAPALNNAATTTYTFTPTAGLCATTTTLTITVNPNVTPTFTAVAPICSGAALAALPTTSTNGITGSWAPALDNTATTTYTFTATAGQCATTTTLTIIVNANVTPTFAAVAPICSGAVLAALPTTSTNGITGTWAPALNNLATTTYTFTPIAGLCATTTTITITVNPNITPTFTTVAPICSGAALAALPTTSTNGITGSWAPALDNTATTTYTFTPTAGLCATTITLTITVNPNVTPTFAAVAPICSGAALAALPTTSTNGITGSWAPALDNTATTTYTFTATAGQCATTTTLTITVNANVTPTFAAVAPICSGAALAALPTTSTNGITGSWAPALDNTATTTYTFTPTAGQCATTTTLTITVNANVTPTFAAVAPICSGAALAALPTTSTNGITGSWAPALNNAATTTYTFTPTAGLCATTTTITITVNPNITPTFTAVAPICSGAALAALPTTSTNGITGSWAPALNNAATNTYTFTPTAGLCATTTTLTITVNPNVTPTFTAVAPICSGAALAALPTTSTNGITGSWAPALNNAATTTYTFTPTAGQCATTTTLTITVNPNITPTFTAVAPICSGAALAALPTTSTNGITGSWAPALNNTATTTYTFTPTAGLCATTTTLTITVNPNITPTFTAVAPICSGAALAALPTTSTNGITGSWAPALDNTATTTYTFTPTAGLCATTTTLTITVNPNITPTFTAVAPICSGAALAALPTTSTNGITGSWAPALNNAATTTYTFTPTAGLCATTTTLTITVNPADNPSFNYAPSTLCQTGPDPSANITGGATGTFSATPVGLVFLDNTTGLIDLSASVINTYTITFTTNGACPSVSTASVTITTAPLATFSYAGPYCTSGIDPLPTFIPGSSAGVFSSTAGLVFVNTATGEVDLSASSPGTYTVTNSIAAAGGCSAVSSTNTITINASVTPTFAAVAPICSGAALAALPTTSTNGIIGSWAPVLDNTTTTTYSFTPTAGQCATTTTLIITVNANVTPTFTAVAPICSGAALAALPTTSTNGITGSWAPVLNNTATTTYTFTPTAGLCATTTTLTITVNPNITPTFTAVAPICSGAALAALPTTSTNGITGTWAPALNNTATTTYTFTPTAGLCATTTTLTITVNPNVTPTFTAVAPICSGAALAALPTTSTNGITGSWAPALNNTATTTYTFTPTAGLCATTTTLTITVNPNVTPTFAAVAPICSGAALAALPTTSTNGITGTWAPALDNTTTTTYTFTPTAGQCATTTTLTITVNPILSPTINCGVSTTSSVSFDWAAIAGATGYTVSYQVNALPVVNVGPIGNVLTYSVSGLTGGDNVTITVTPTGGAGTCFTSSTISCIATSCTPPTANISYATPFCASIVTPQPVTLTGTGSYTGGTYSGPAGLTIDGLTGSIIPSTSIAGPYTVSYTVAGVGGCPGITVTTSVTINPLITPAFTAVAPICSGAALAALPTTSTNGITGSWAPALNNTTTTTYTFTPTAGLCATTTTLTITVNPNVTPTFTAVAPICSGAALAALPTTSTNGITGTWAPALNNTATTTYTFTPTAGLCATTTTLTITVNPNVTPTFTAVAPICSGAALAALPTTSTNGITGSWAPALNNAATTTYTFTPTAGLCATTTTLTITVNPNVTPTFTAVAPICSGAALAALPTTSTNGITGSWAPVLNNTATTTYTFTPTAGLCATTTTLTITVNPNITPTFTAVAPICSGAALAALPTTSTNGITGTWAPALNNTATTTYTFTPTAGLCATTTILTITVNPNVTPTFTAVAPICSGAALAALPTTSTNGITGTWAPALNNTATTTYTFTPTAGLCATTTTLTITVNPNVTPTFAAVAPICSGAALAALPTTSTNGITGTWAPALDNTTTTTYTFTPTAGQCATTTTLTITVNPILSPTINCGVSTTSSVSFDWAAIAGATGYTVSYQVNALPVVNVGPIGNVLTYSVSGLTGGDNVTITVTPTGGAGTCFTSSTISCIATSCTPPTANISYATPFCASIVTPQPVTLTGTGSYTGGTYSGPAGLTIDGLTGSIIPSTSIAGPYTVSYTVAGVGGCPGITVTTSVTIDPLITPAFTAVAPICSGAALAALPTTSTNGITGSWAPALNNAATTTYTFTPTAGQCATTTTLTITVNANVTPTFAAVAPICPGAALAALPTTSTNGITGSWAPALNNTATTTYTFTPTAGLCATTTTLTITVNPADNPSFNYAPSTLCQTGPDPSANITGGATGTFSATPVGLVFLDNTTGLIDLSASVINTYTITFTTNGACPSVSTASVTITTAPLATFSYAGPYCTSGIDPLPTFIPGSSAGVFSSTAGLVFVNTATGEVDLSASSPGTYTVTNSIAAAGGCSAVSSTNTITINASVTPTFAAVAPICSGAALAALPTTSTNGIIGSWAPVLDNTTTTTYSFTPTAGQCATTTTLIITVNANVTPTFTAVAPICSGAALAALPTTSTNGITGSWAPVLNNTATTTYTFTPTAGLCATTTTLTITVNPNVTPTFTAVAPICSGAALAALPTTSTNGITGTWAPALNNAATTTYTFTPTAGLCATTTTLTITVNPNVTPTFTAVAPICSGAALAALPTTSTNGITGTWAPALDNTTTTIYTFTPTAGQCATTTTLTITVNPNVTPTFAAVAPICSGAALAALPTTSTNGITGTWAPALDNTTTTTYTFTPTAGQCATTTTLTITVNPILSPTINCGVSTTSSVSFDWAAIAGATGYTVSYQVNALPVVNVGPIGNVLTYSVSGLTGGDNVTITVTPTGGAGTCFISSTISCIAISCTPPTANISYATPFCASIVTPQPVTLTGTGSYTGGTYSGPAGLTIDGLTGSIIPSTSIAGPYTVSYTVTGVGGCPGITVTTSVTINPLITPAFTAVAPICSGAALAALPTTSTNGITGSWAPALNNTTTTTYTFTPTAGLCATTTTLTITVNPNVTPTFAAVAPICSGAALAALPTTSTNGITGSWAPALDNTTTTTYTFTPTAGLCATTTTLTITVNPNVTPTFAAVAPICSGAALAALPTTSTNGITGSWAPALNNTATTTYTFTPTAGLCATTTTLTITVNPNVTPTFAAVAPICSGAALAALPTTSTNGITGTWAPALDNTTTTTYTFTPAAGQCATTTTLTITVNPILSPTINCGVSTTSSVSFDWAAIAGATGYTVSYQVNALPVVNVGPIGNVLTYSVSGLTGGDNVTITVTPMGGAGTCFTSSTISCIATSCTPPTANISYATPFCASIVTPQPVTLTGTGSYTGGTYSGPAGLTIDGLTGSIIPSTSIAGPYTVSYTVAGVGGCPGITVTTSVTIDPLITPAFTAVAPICSGAALAALPTTSTNGITGTWAPALDNTTTTTYTFTPTAGQCATTTTLTITVNPILSPTINCGVSTTSSVSFDWAAIAGATGYTVSYQVNALPVVNVGPIGNVLTYSVSGLTGGDNVTITVTPTGGAGTCFTSSTISCIATSCTPPTANISYATPFCASIVTPQPVTLTGTGSYTGGTYSGPAGLTIDGLTGSIIPSTSIAGPYTVSYTVAGVGGCPGITVTTSVTIDPLITPAFTAVAPICSGAALAALPTTSTNGITGSWAPALNNTTTTTYTFTPTAGLCATTTTLTITVNPNVTPTFTAVAPICSGAALAALPTTSTNGITGSWAPALNNTATTTYTFTLTAGQCATTTILTITVNANVIPTFAAVAPICPGAALAALPTTSNNGITGTWTPALDNTATTTYTFTPTAGQCATTTTLTISVNANVTPTFAAVAPICSGAALAALPTTSTNGITGTWAPALNNLATTTYTFTPTAGQCATTTILTITVNANVTPTFTAIGPLCLNSVPPVLPVSSTNIPPIPGTWNASISTAVAGTTVYTFTPTAGICATTATMSITTVTQIVPTFAQIGPLCQNSVPPALPTTSTNVPPIVGTWNAAISTATVGTTVYTFTPTAGQCETTTTMSITVNPIPVVTATATPATICNGASSSLSASSTIVGTSYVWNPGPLNGTPVTVTPSATTTYTVTGTFTGCSGTATVTVTVNPNPVLTPTATPASICEGASSTLTVNSNIAGTLFGWLPDSLTGSPVTVTPTATTIYTVAGLSPAGCTATDTITVTVNPNPVVTSTATPATICNGDPSSLVANSTVAGTNFVWNPGGLAGTPISVTPGSNTTYTVTGTTAAGCTGTSSVAVTVNPVPVVTATATPALICYGSSSTLNATSTIPGTAYNWMPGPLNGSTVTVNPLTTTIYTLTGTSPAGCTGSTNVIVTVSPPVVFTADIFEGCEDLLVSFSDLSNITNAVSWYWDFGDHSFSYLQNPQHLYVDPGVYNVTLTITSSTGCTTTYSWLNMITVHKVPNAFFAANPTNVDEMDPTVFFTDQSVGASGWNWYFGDISSMDNISNLQNPLHTYVGGVGTYTTTLIVNSDYGCADTVQHDINVLPTVAFYIPNAFTPNTDGTNEGFKGQGVGIKEETFEMIIYSRWGEELYRSTDINESWNGTDARKGGTCEQGVYIYLVSFTDKLGEYHTLKGTVTLVK